MPTPNTDRNLLIGILALQIDFISRDQLVSAMGEWVLDRSQSLDQILVAMNAIDDATRDLILALVDKHLERHQGDPQQGLAALSTVGESLREDLRCLADPQIEATLTIVGSYQLTAQDRSDLQPIVSLGQPSSEVRFRILRPHAKGGLGKVSVALDQELHREVALKEIQEQYADEPESRARFLLEAEVTGGLEHPGIVPVYGLGTYSNGRPFYAMRFIRGDSLQEAADRFHQSDVGKSSRGLQGLEFRQLIGRFIDVCQAMEYAHSRCVLHRDLKPGNIMLGRYGETLIVDWGLSKVIGRDDMQPSSGEATLKPSSGSGSSPTLMGSAIGTPQFMSPEQAEGRLDQLGPTSDVYSLGATLSYLLTGRSPFDGVGIAEVLLQVRKGKITPPRQVNSGVPRSLEAVCLKAMSLHPMDRYATAIELAVDLERWLADEPVSCFREPIIVRVGRWTRRNRTLVTSLAVTSFIVLLSLSGGLALVANHNRQLASEKQKTDEANGKLAESNRLLQLANDLERMARIEADEQRARAKEAIDYYVTTVIEEEVLTSDKFQPLRRRLLAESLTFYQELAEGEREESDSRNDLAAALDQVRQISMVSGFKQESLSAAQEMEKLCAEMAKQDPADHERQLQWAESLFWLGDAHSQMSNQDQALEYFQESLNVSESLSLTANNQGLTPELNDSIQSFQQLAHMRIGIEQMEAGELLSAEKHMLESLELKGVDLSDLSDPESDQQVDPLDRSNLGLLYRKLGQTKNAYAQLSMAHSAITKRFEEYPDTYRTHLASIESNLGVIQSELGNQRDARETLEHASRLWQEEADSGVTKVDAQTELAWSFDNLANLSARQGLWSDACEYLEKEILAWETLEKALPNLPHYPGRIADAEVRLSQLHAQALDLVAAMEADQRSLAARERELLASQSSLGHSHPRTRFLLNHLGVLHWQRGELEKSVPLFEQLVRACEESLDDADREIWLARANLGINYIDSGRLNEGLRLLELSYQSGEDAVDWVKVPLRDAYVRAEKKLEAAAITRELLAELRDSLPPDSQDLASSLINGAKELHELDDSVTAEALLRECLVIYQLKVPDEWLFHHTQSLLGAVLMDQKKMGEAEQMLLDGWRGMQLRLDIIPNSAITNYTNAIERLVDFYRITEKSDERERWQSELDAWKQSSGNTESAPPQEAPNESLRQEPQPGASDR